MSNKDKYKQAFSVLHASRVTVPKETSMDAKVAKRALRPAFAVAISVAAVFGCAAGAYATDLGGIQEKIRVWFNGGAVEAQLVQDPESETGSYTLTIPAAEEGGEERVISGGGVAVDENGIERPVTMEEIEELYASDVDSDEDGNIWIYDHGQSYNITDLMTDGACHVVIQGEDGQLIYYDIEDNGSGGYAYSRSLTPQVAEGEYVQL